MGDKQSFLKTKGKGTCSPSRGVSQLISASSLNRDQNLMRWSKFSWELSRESAVFLFFPPTSASLRRKSSFRLHRTNLNLQFYYSPQDILIQIWPNHALRALVTHKKTGQLRVPCKNYKLLKYGTGYWYISTYIDVEQSSEDLETQAWKSPPTLTDFWTPRWLIVLNLSFISTKQGK